MKKIIILTLMILYAIQGHACSCGFQTMSVQKILNYDLVFEGKIINKETETSDSQEENVFLQMGQYKYTFEITDLINGSVESSKVVIYSNIQGSACGVNYSVDDEFIIYSYQYNGRYNTSLCDDNKRTNKLDKKYRCVIKKFKKAKKQQKWKDIDGDLIAKGAVTNQQATGEWIFYHKDGSLESVGTFVNGKRNGEWHEYLSEGMSSRFMKKEKNEQHFSKIKNPKNIHHRTIVYKNGERLSAEYLYQGG